jgi:hypothetical protein
VIARRTLHAAGLLVSLTSLAFSLGMWWAQHHVARQIADRDAELATLSRSVLEMQHAVVGTSGQRAEVPAASIGADPALVDAIKKQIQSEMGLFPVRLLRERRASFVELHAVDMQGVTSYGTAGHLGGGYFITVKHAVVALGAGGDARMGKITVRIGDSDLPVSVVDAGDADMEVHPGDWAIVKTKAEVDLPALRIDTAYGYEFADPIVRLGNDYSKGIILSTGYVGQRTAAGLVTCLTDGHPGVSGGGVLNQEGDLVGIPIGRMQADYRFSFILPLRTEMFRKVPGLQPETGIVGGGD